MRSRQLLELCVGDKYTVEVVLHLRRKDIEWYHSKTEYEKEFYQLLSEKVLPKVFASKEEEQEEEEEKKKKKKRKAQAGEKQHAKKKATTLNELNKKRKRKSSTPPQTTTLPPEEKEQRDVRHVFGDEIQLTYRTEPISRGEALTLYIEPGKDLELKEYPKLDKRIVAWCFRLNKDDPTEPDPSDGGFPRPEMIPLSDIFRPSVDLSDDDFDEEEAK